MKKYEANEDSDIEWVSSIPMNWKVIPAKALWKVRKEPVGDNASPEDLISVSEYYGVAPRVKKIDSDETLMRAESLDGYQLCYPGDLVMNIMLAWKGAQGISAYEGIVSPSYVVYKPICSHDICPRYFHYLLRCDTYKTVFKRWSTGIIDSRLRLYPEAFLRIPLLLPPKSVQEAIATFLDTKTTEIDSLIVKTERSIKLLEEYRKSVISGAVTKGLDPDTPMKDSGIEWIGEIPQAWSAQPLKYITSSIESGRSVDGANCPANENEPGVLTLSSVYKASFNPQANKAVEDAESISLLRCPVKGESLLISRCNTSEWVGTAAIVEKDIPNLFLPDKIWQLGFSSWPLCRWIWYYLQSNYARHYFAVNSVGASSTMQNVSKDDLLALVIPVPPASEQDAILVHLDKEIAAISQSVATRRRLIEKLQEYRKSLIYEAVTGKFKVSGAE